MRQLVYDVAMTLDHFVAHEDGSLGGFLSEGEHVADYSQRLQGYDTVVMGRKTLLFGSGLSSRLEELDRIPVGIFHLDLPAARTRFHLIAKLHPRALQSVDLCRQIGHSKHHSIPTARLLGLAAGRRAGSRRAWPAEQQREISERHTGERGELLMFQPEAEMVRVERGRPGDILDLIAHAVHAEASMWLSTVCFTGHRGRSSLCLVHHKVLRLLSAMRAISSPQSFDRPSDR
jgi:hypothetical protein